MTQRYIKKSDAENAVESPEIFVAKQWMAHGDHDSVIPVPIDNDFWESQEGRHGALRFGWLDIQDAGCLVTPTDYIVADANGNLTAEKADIFVLKYVLFDRVI